MLLYELTRLVEEGRSAKDTSEGMPEADSKPRTTVPSELKALLESLGTEFAKRELVKA
ncbi:MAG TPA: hypothetical protein VEZ72_01055 [Paenibacillus sp.]|nr:hypothetical protein [Paenibacillus sp.]